MRTSALCKYAYKLQTSEKSSWNADESNRSLIISKPLIHNNIIYYRIENHNVNKQNIKTSAEVS